MLTIPVYNSKGDEIAKKDLNLDIFGLKPNMPLIKQVVDAQFANARLVLAHTKTRSFVRGGGKKPWKQKGTGRARHGSIRSPLWRHGAVTFGPSNERNFSKSINKKMKKKALFMVLSDKVKNENFKLIDDYNIDKINTKNFLALLKNVVKEVNTLVVLDEKDEKVVLSLRNLPNTAVILADSLNVVDLLKYKNVIMPTKALDIIEKVYL